MWCCFFQTNQLAEHNIPIKTAELLLEIIGVCLPRCCATLGGSSSAHLNIHTKLLAESITLKQGRTAWIVIPDANLAQISQETKV